MLGPFALWLFLRASPERLFSCSHLTSLLFENPVPR
jgi:hypothetical protein